MRNDRRGLGQRGQRGERGSQRMTADNWTVAEQVCLQTNESASNDLIAIIAD